MTENRKRSYRSQLRAEQTGRTRSLILSAAERLFLSRGYPGTSMDAIAEAATVSRQTVFSAFGSKAALLKELIHARIVGEDAPVRAAQRAALDTLREERDPHRLLRHNAHVVAQIAVRAAPIMEVIVAAAQTEADVRELLQQIDQQWLAGMAETVALLARLGALPPDADQVRASQSLWLLTAASSYRMAMTCGWTLDEYEEWIADCSVALLIGSGNASSPRPSSA